MKNSRQWGNARIILLMIILLNAEVLLNAQRMRMEPNHHFMERVERRLERNRDNFFTIKPTWANYTQLWYYTDKELVVITFRCSRFPKIKRIRNEGLANYKTKDAVFSYNNYYPDVLDGIQLRVFIRNLEVDFETDLYEFLYGAPSESSLEAKIKYDIIKHVSIFELDNHFL